MTLKETGDMKCCRDDILLIPDSFKKKPSDFLILHKISRKITCFFSKMFFTNEKHFL